jgi:hypothetical protein
MKPLNLIFAFLLMITGCSSDHPGGHKVTSECAALQKIVSENIRAGMPKEELLAFFQSRGWDASYGKLDDAYYLRFPYPSKTWDHVVTVTVWLENSERVKNYKVTDNYVAP